MCDSGKLQSRDLIGRRVVRRLARSLEVGAGTSKRALAGMGANIGQ